MAQLEHVGAGQPSYVVGATTGISYQVPGASDLPENITAGLSSLGIRSTLVDYMAPNRLQRTLVRRKIRGELRDRRMVAVHGVGLSAFGPTWGLIVGCDDQRGVWRREGPMTEQVSPWLPEADFNRLSRVTLIAARRAASPDRDEIAATAERALAESSAPALRDLADRIGLLDSNVEIEPQQYSHDVQTLAGNWGEAATFWREFPHAVYTPVAQHMAVTLSRYATLFPYPMGGQPNNPGVRSAAVHILRDASDALDAAR